MKSRIQLGDSPASAKHAGELVCEHQNSGLHTRAIAPRLKDDEARSRFRLAGNDATGRRPPGQFCDIASAASTVRLLISSF
jgi:hypothetical protein